jgi:hypothetical protein
MTTQPVVANGRRSWFQMAVRPFADWVYGPPAPARMTLRVGLWAIALAVVGAIIAFLRLPPSARNVLWAEDSSVFVTGALQHRPFLSLFEPFAGYMHSVPRLTSALVVSVIPIDSVPVAIAIVACTITSICATVAFLILRSRIPSLFPRLLVWFGIITLPIGGIEANGSIANSHWYLLVALFAVLVAREQNTVTRAVACVVIAFAVTSDALALVFLPLALGRLLIAERRKDLWVPLVYFGALIIQFLVVLHSSVQPAAAKPTIFSIIRALGFRVFLTSFTGFYGSMFSWAQLHLVSIAVAGVLVVGIVVLAALNRRQLGGLATVALVGAVTMYSAEVIIRWNPQFDPETAITWGGSRYSIIPLSLLLIAFAAATEAWRKRWVTRTIVRQLAAATLAVLLVVIAVPAFTYTTRVAQESWRVEISQARHECAATGPNHELKVAGVPTNFTLDVSCVQLGFR